MASIVTESNGRKRIEFFAADGKRKRIRLGVIAKCDAQTIKTHVGYIVASQKSKQPLRPATAEWLGELDGQLRDRLVAVGLAEAREPVAASAAVEIVTLGAFLEKAITANRKAKPSTRTFYQHTKRCLIEYFGAEKPLCTITVADAKRFKDWLATHEFPKGHGRKGGKLSDSTVRRRCTLARQFFTEAVDDELIQNNPFRKLKEIGVKANRSRDYFLSREDAAKILDVCPDAEWRLLFALSRYGGLRCPSEHLALTWGHVDWLGKKITVPVPKLEHRGEEHATRVIPLFPELRPYLEDCFTLAGARGIDPTEPIITRYRSANCNLRTQLERIVKRAGLKPWPKLFQNLRATRETELAETFPLQVACAWIGNSQAVARKHYLQVTEDHFEAAQKAAQYPVITDGKAVHGEARAPENCGKLAISAESTSVQWAAQDSNL